MPKHSKHIVKEGEHMATKKITSLQEQANEILERAEEKGLNTNFFFRTTFKRYQVQMNILADLERHIKEEGSTVTKEYVKGRGNIYVNPSIVSYNKTATAANGTVSTLINILKAFSDETGSKSKLMQMFDDMNDDEPDEFDE